VSALTPEKRERPILFSGPMIRAILAGAKTVTRRVVKPQPPMGCAYLINANGDAALCVDEESARAGVTASTRFVPPTPRSKDHRLPCPYGRPGYRLWVRETWWECPCGCDQIVYREKFNAGGYPNLPTAPTTWRPSIFMKRAASRITLEVVSVRVERLHEIDEADAVREGVDAVSVADVPRNGTLSRRDDFAQLWQKINGKRAPWASNPWVWRVEFGRVTA
jgi:hypothetical protein